MKRNSISNILRIAALLAAVLCLAVFGVSLAESEVTEEIPDNKTPSNAGDTFSDAGEGAAQEE